MTEKHLAFFVTEDWYFRSHRLPLALAAREAGFGVTVITTPGDVVNELTESGLRVELIPIRRELNPIMDVVTWWELRKIYRRLKPTIVHHVSLKPILLGSLVAIHMSTPPKVVNAITGLGHTFTTGGLKTRIARRLVTSILRNASRHWNVFTLFQNSDDRDRLVALNAADQKRSVVIRGSGVDMHQYRPSPEPEGPPLVVLPARLLQTKGVEEFVTASRSLIRAGVEARFALVGEPDLANPSSITLAQWNKWQREGLVECWGWQRDMMGVLSESSVVCLPSHGGEGVPRCLIEAAAAGRPIVTTDVPGCREVVIDGFNGLLVPPLDAERLAEALGKLIEDPRLRQVMGTNGRGRAQALFSQDLVIRETLELYHRVTGGMTPPRNRELR